MLESPGTQFVRGLPLFLLARRDEIMKCYFKPWPNGVASRGLCLQRLVTLIFLCQFLASFSFLTKCNSSHLETLLRFCMEMELEMEMFKYSEFDLERTTAKSTIMFTFFSISSFDRRCPSLQSSKQYFCFDSWKSPITIHKTCHRVVKKRNGDGNKKYGSSRQAVPRGFAASLAIQK